MPLSETSLHRAATHLLPGRLRPPTPIGHLPVECRPRNVDDAMAVQDVLHGLLTANGHGRVVGSKIGCTTQVMQEFLGMTHPCAGAVFDTTVYHRAGDLDSQSYLHVGAECEIAVTLGKGIRAADAPHTIDSVADAVTAVFPAIEIVDDRYADLVAREPDWRTWIADDFFGAGIVLGEPVDRWRDLDLAAMVGSMCINGTVVGTGHGRDVINGHPLEALVWLANAEAARGRDIPVDWIVMLGSVVQTKWVARGDVVQVHIDGLGSACARFL